MFETIDGWMATNDYCKKYGEKPATIHKRVSTGLWERGVIYSTPDGKVGYVHEERARAWIKARDERKALEESQRFRPPVTEAQQDLA